MKYSLLEEVYKDTDIISKQNNYNNIVNDIIKNKNTRFDNNYNRFDNQYIKEDKKYMGIEYNNSKKSNYNSYSEYANYTNEPHEEEILAKQIEEKISKRENFTQQNECNDEFLKHCLTCDKCKQKILKYLKDNNQIDNIKNDEILDIVIYALTGIFILFLLDFFTKLGKLNSK